MSEELKSAAAALEERLAGASFDGSVRFEIEDQGVIRIANGGVTVGDNAEADVTISASLETFREIFDGALSPTNAFMTGRMRVDGDMAMAMQLGQILG